MTKEHPYTDLIAETINDLDSAPNVLELKFLLENFATDLLDKECASCCKNKAQRQREHDDLVDELRGQTEQLGTKINTLDNHGCMVLIIIAMVVGGCLMYASDTYIQTTNVLKGTPEVPKWVDKDVNLLRYGGKLWRCEEVERPILKVSPTVDTKKK